MKRFVQQINSSVSQSIFTSCFLQKIKRKKTEKKRKERKLNHSCHFSLGYYCKQIFVPPVSAIFCRNDFPYFSRLTPPYLYSIAVDQQRRQLALRFYSRWYYVRTGVGVSARRLGSAMNRYHTKQTKIFRPKIFLFIFSKKFEETFRCSEDKFREHL